MVKKVVKYNFLNQVKNGDMYVKTIFACFTHDFMLLLYDPIIFAQCLNKFERWTEILVCTKEIKEVVESEVIVDLP